MKLIKKIILVLIFSVIYQGFSAIALPVNTGKQFLKISPLEEEIVYWYFLRIRVDERTKKYEILGSGNQIMSGTKQDFNKQVWWGVARRQIAIGPFFSQTEALNSRLYYKKSKDKVVETVVGEVPEQIHWFQMTVIQLKRIGAYQFSRSPAAVTSGSTSQFIDALYEGISFQMLSIGPFWDYTRAEEAKAIYRQNE